MRPLLVVVAWRDSSARVVSQSEVARHASETSGGQVCSRSTAHSCGLIPTHRRYQANTCIPALIHRLDLANICIQVLDLLTHCINQANICKCQVLKHYINQANIYKCQVLKHFTDRASICGQIQMHRTDHQSHDTSTNITDSLPVMSSF